ncbi:substrate-binding periplasmic protein [Dongshaea marina]|uniref:substrate-binding periplasmic protein n=1 Tax=Dongshaea marina TaxID=2047966 RepID=UPI00131F311B|nr:ABC transporter substrate-binding protein [Dongshaea marina]
MDCRLIIALCLSFILSGQAKSASPSGQDFTRLSYVTEEFPPYNYRHNGELKGIAVELLLAAAREAGYSMRSQDIKCNSWARSYNLALNVQGYVLFSTARTLEREALFKWAGPIVPNIEVILVALRERHLRIAMDSELNSYRIGVIRSDAGQQYVIRVGVDPDKLVVTHKPKLLARQLLNRRIDLWATTASVFDTLEKLGLERNKFEVVYSLGASAPYYALNKKTPDQLVASFQRAIDKVKDSDEYQLILSDYGHPLAGKSKGAP